MLEVEDTGVVVAGGTLNVARLGAGDGAAEVVAVHGITSSSRAWTAVARALAGRTTLYAVDLRGRGSSRGLPAPYGLGVHCDDLLAVLDSLALERAVLAGHSLGAYVVARFAIEHPERVRAVLMVDGGLDIPGAAGVDPQAFAEAFLGPALARLKMRFSGVDEYYRWWREHPALGGDEVAEADLFAYAEHDLVDGRPAVSSDAVRADVLGLVETNYARELAVPARMLTAPRGLADEPSPMQPIDAAREWAAEDPARRSAALVPDVNHYTITLGRTGAVRVADEIRQLVS